MERLTIGHAINPALAVLTTFMVAKTDEEALKRSANGPAFFSHSLGYYYNPFTGAKHQPGEANIYREFLKTNERDNTMSLRNGFVGESEIREGEPKDEVQRALYRAARSGTAVGTANRVRKTLETYEKQHLDVMILVAQCGDRKHEHIMEAIIELSDHVIVLASGEKIAEGTPQQVTSDERVIEAYLGTD